ncbi:hypothetical protein [Cellulomonas wangsupingiae]|uniref:hypothetical protein n=1 Tax=Cellulomonas wangsupingiae TaxID=2968085 RepID=UPI001D0DEB68|nr:hypothetical protein [Cellulomonas wangsupingiae]MCC2334972.1 hypothetical protein [Cellulomonas wangsupingiae]MCM0638844.1 hypothetical protein [Cellulomonas wangsupingiae]
MPRPPTVLRAAGPADAEAAGTVHHACWVETYAQLANQEFWDRVSPSAASGRGDACSRRGSTRRWPRSAA